MLMRKEELVEKGLIVLFNGEQIFGVEECDPLNGWVRLRSGGLHASRNTTKKRGKVEVVPKSASAPVFQANTWDEEDNDK